MKRMLVLLILSLFLLVSCSVPDKKAGESNPNPEEKISEKAKEPEENASEGHLKVEIGLTEGKAAPEFTLKDIDGKDVSLSDYRGKTVIVNFFGVWCPWCVREMPGFISVYNDYRDKGLELLIVDVGDTKETLVDYLKENNFNIKPVMDDNQEVSNLYRVSGFPTSFILDGDGIILRAHRGYMDEGLLRTFLDTAME